LLSLNAYPHTFSLRSVGVITDETWILLLPLPPAVSEVRAVICFLHTEGQSVAKIRQLCLAYGDNVMSDSCVREWCRKFSDGCTDVHDEGGQGQHSTVVDELVQKVIREFC
jgi:hypothetical protein